MTLALSLLITDAMIAYESSPLQRILSAALPHIDRLVIRDVCIDHPGAGFQETSGVCNLAGFHAWYTDNGAWTVAPSTGTESDSDDRNRAISAGEAHGDFVLLLDGDEILVDDIDDLRCWCSDHAKTNYQAAAIVVRNLTTGVESLEPRILRKGSGWSYRGRAAPLLNPPQAPWPPLVARLDLPRIDRTPFAPTAASVERDISRFRRDLADAESPSAPSKSRTLLYLAAALEIHGLRFSGHGSLFEAEQLYEQRLVEISRSPEDYLALMWAGQHFESKGDLKRAGSLYNAAALRFPDRAEPFYAMAKMDFGSGALAAALLACQRGLWLELPDLARHHGVLPAVYTHLLATLAGDIAYPLGKYDVALAAYERAFEGAPADARPALEAKLWATRAKASAESAP